MLKKLKRICVQNHVAVSLTKPKTGEETTAMCLSETNSECIAQNEPCLDNCDDCTKNFRSIAPDIFRFHITILTMPTSFLLIKRGVVWLIMGAATTVVKKTHNSNKNDIKTVALNQLQLIIFCVILEFGWPLVDPLKTYALPAF